MRTTLLFLVLLFIIVIMPGCKGDNEPVELSNSTESILRELSIQSKKLGPHTELTNDELLNLKSSIIFADLTKISNARLQLAYSHLVEGDYTNCIFELRSVLGRKPKDADIHEALACAYYELAILDMINRELYTQSHIGLYIFHPDNRTRSVFLAAKAEFDKAAELGLISPSFKDLSLYNSNTHEDEEITVDQVKAIQWLIALSNNDPSILKQVKRNLDIFFTWSYLSDKSFPIYNGILVEARKKHHELLNTVDKF